MHHFLFLCFCFFQRSFEDEKQPLSSGLIVACSRHIKGDLSLLAAALDIDDQDMTTIKTKFKSIQGQALQMLKKWQSSGTHTKHELAEILEGAGFPQAAEMYVLV